MKAQEIQKHINRIVGTEGILRIPSWWMHKILSDIVRYCEEKGNGNADELRDEIYKGLPDEDIEFLKENGVMASVIEAMESSNTGLRDINQRVRDLENKQFVIALNELPANPRSNTIYLIPAQNAEGNNIFAEWVYINGSWEKFGEFNTSVDFSQYAQKSEIPTKTSQLTNDSGFITKSYAPDWNASSYKDGHIKNRTHHMQDHMCNYFNGSPVKISRPSDVGYVLLTYDTDLVNKFIRIEINANESKTYEFVDAMGMPLIFTWDSGNSTINVESFMGAIETYDMRAYYSSSAKGFEDYFTKLDKGFIPKEVITNENASFMDNSSSIILPFGIKSGDFKTYSVVGDGSSILGQRKVDLGEINDSRENVIVATWLYSEVWGHGFAEYGEFTIDELKEKNKYGEEYHWLLEGKGIVGVKVDENNHLWAFLSGSDANSWTIQYNAYSEKTRMDSSWIKHNGEDLSAKIASLEARIEQLEGKN